MSKTPLLKRRLNPFLIASTVLVLSLLAGLSVMYQGQLSDLVGDKKDLQQKLEDREQRISELQAKNSNLTDELESTEGDLGKYSRLYQQTRQERNTLRNKVDSLESTVDQKNTEISNLENDIRTLESDLSSTRQDFKDVCSSTPNRNMTDAAEALCDSHFN